MQTAELQIKDLSKQFENGVTAIQHISSNIRPGEFVAVLGPSGCGKSTLLKLISNLEQPTRGSIQWAHSTPPRIGYVFQDAHLLPWKNVFENVALALRLRGEPTSAVEARVNETLKMVGLSEFASAYPSQLSGGMKMRVSLCRALVTEPQVLLLDEPFAALDEFTRQNLDQELRNLWMIHKMTVIFVTHSISEAAFLANRYLVFSKRPGQILADFESRLPLERHLKIKLEAPYLEEIRKLSEAFHES